MGRSRRAKALLRWSATEREAWLDAVTRDPLLPGGIYCRRMIWGNRRGRDGWKCCATPSAQLRTFNPEESGADRA